MTYVNRVTKPATSADTLTVFEPRGCGAFPKQFGKSAAGLRPAPGMDVRDPRFIAAQFQHRVCNAVREWFVASGETHQGFAETLKSENVPGASSDRLSRVLRGVNLMQLAELVFFAARVAEVRKLLLSENTWLIDPIARLGES